MKPGVFYLQKMMNFVKPGVFYLQKMMNFMKMRTFYKKLPLFIKKLNFAYLQKTQTSNMSFIKKTPFLELIETPGPGCLSSLLHLARHFLPNLPSPLCLPCWPVFFSSRLSSSVNCQSYLLLHNFFQVTIQESREGLAVWLLWGFFELIMKVTHCKTDF